MPEKPTALVVEDNDKWAETFEEALTSDFAVVKAKSLRDVRQILESDERVIQIALVDILLEESEMAKASGLDVMFILNRQGIPCIAATAYDNKAAVRDALVTAGAKDVWFKMQDSFLMLREKIELVISAERKKSIAPKSSQVSSFFPAVDGEIDLKLVFVIMPFTEKWSSETLGIIKLVAENQGLNVVRVR